MKKILKAVLAAAAAAMLLFLLCMPAYGLRASECGLKVVKNNSYTKDGKFYMSFNITAGSPSRAPHGYTTYMEAKLLNSSGTAVFTWSRREQSIYTTKTQLFSADYSKLPSGTYTFNLKLISRWGEYNRTEVSSASFQWNYKLSHTRPSAIQLSRVEVAAQTDATYTNKFIFSHSGAKGKQINLEIYNPNGNRVYARKSQNPISYTSGTYSIQWNGYPTGGGAKCGSGEYTIKYWLEGKSAKQAKLYLTIY